MELQSVNLCLQMQDGGIQDGCSELKIAISQFRLNLERVCVRCYGSINPKESVKLPSVNYFDESKIATSKMAVSKIASFCCIASKHLFVPAVTFYHYIGRQQRSTSNPLS